VEADHQRVERRVETAKIKKTTKQRGKEVFQQGSFPFSCDWGRKVPNQKTYTGRESKKLQRDVENKGKGRLGDSRVKPLGKREKPAVESVWERGGGPKEKGKLGGKVNKALRSLWDRYPAGKKSLKKDSGKLEGEASGREKAACVFGKEKSMEGGRRSEVVWYGSPRGKPEILCRRGSLAPSGKNEIESGLRLNKPGGLYNGGHKRGKNRESGVNERKILGKKESMYPRTLETEGERGVKGVLIL